MSPSSLSSTISPLLEHVEVGKILNPPPKNKYKFMAKMYNTPTFKMGESTVSVLQCEHNKMVIMASLQTRHKFIHE